MAEQEASSDAALARAVPSSQMEWSSAVREQLKQRRNVLDRIRSVVGVRFHVDRKAVQRAIRQLEKASGVCRNVGDALRLSQSPPCLLELLSSIHKIIQAIVRKAEPGDENLHKLDSCSVFRLTIENVILRCKQLSQLLKSAQAKAAPTAESDGALAAAQAIADKPENSQIQRDLLMVSILFNYINCELKVFFQNGSFIGNAGCESVIRKQDAREFWKKNFDGQPVVPWREFFRAFSKDHSPQVQITPNSKDEMLLRNAMDLTWNEHISAFELDVFSRLFQPWTTMLMNWQWLTCHPACKPYLTYEQVHSLLEKYLDKPGTYLFRYSTTNVGSWSIAFVTKEKRIKQTVLRNEPLIPSLLEGKESGKYLYPNGQHSEDTESKVSEDILAQASVHVPVSKEQFIEYMNSGTPFQMCKICYSRVKNRRLEPCRHLICCQCLQDWLGLTSKKQRERNAPKACCPFCREPIDGSEAIVFTPFQPDPNDTDIRARMDAMRPSETDVTIQDSDDDSNHVSTLSPSPTAHSTRCSADISGTSMSLLTPMSADPLLASSMTSSNCDNILISDQRDIEASSVAEFQPVRRNSRQSESDQMPAAACGRSSGTSFQLAVPAIVAHNDSPLNEEHKSSPPLAVQHQLPTLAPMPQSISVMMDAAASALGPDAGDFVSARRRMTSVGPAEQLPASHPLNTGTVNKEVMNYITMDFTSSSTPKAMPGQTPASQGNVAANSLYSSVTVLSPKPAAQIKLNASALQDRTVYTGARPEIAHATHSPLRARPRSLTQSFVMRAGPSTVRLALLSLGYKENDVKYALEAANYDLSVAKTILEKYNKRKEPS